MKISNFMYIFWIFVIQLVSEEVYKFEGFFKDHVGEKRYELLSLFLPYNPVILLNSEMSEAMETCIHYWPKCKVVTSPTIVPNFLWFKFDRTNLLNIKRLAPILHRLHVVYFTTHFLKSMDVDYNVLKEYLEKNQFKLLSHWYQENGSREVIFIRTDIYNAVINALNYSSFTTSSPICKSTPGHIEQFFRKINDKPYSSQHGVEQIDFMYMINLDERPEKFIKSSKHFQKYNIQPYRFSAVNGWKLPFEALEEVGVKLAERLSQEKYMATTFKYIDGKEYRGSELIQEKESTYFSIGMTRGTIGIILSHLSVLQDAYDSGYQCIWVLEDDAEPLDDPHKLSHLIKKLDELAPDWDILFTDIDQTDHQVREYVPCRALAMRPNYKIEAMQVFLDKFCPVGDDFTRVSMRYGAYSMILRRSGIEKILNFYKTYGLFLPYDMDYWLIPDLKMYALRYDIVVHGLNAATDNAKPNYLE